jgi:hypothetical protein
MWRPQFSLKTMLWLVALFAAFFAGMVLLWRVSRRPLQIEFSGDYYSDGAGDLRFEFVIEGTTPRPKRIPASSVATTPKPGAQE